MIEKIGEMTCQTHILPFVRPSAALQSEAAFWSIGVEAPAALGLQPPPVHIPDVTIPIVRYAAAARKPKLVTQKPPKRLKSKPSVELSDSSSDSELEDKKTETPDQPTVPSAWDCKREDAKLGSFAMLEVVYGKRGNFKKGISLVKVRPFVCFGDARVLLASARAGVCVCVCVCDTFVFFCSYDSLF